MADAVCPRCGTRLLPNALRCINCELPIPQVQAAEVPAGPPPYQLPPAWGTPPQSQAPPPPQYGAPPPYVGPVPYAPGYYPMGPVPWTTNGLAIASLVLALLWLGGLGSLLGVIFGHVSRRQIKKRPQRGEGIGLAGLIIGYLGLIATIILYASLPSIINSGLVQNQLVQNDMSSAASAEDHYLRDSGTYTNDGVALRNEGFDPLGHNTIYAAFHAGDGYCLIGARTGSHSWYLYDSENGGLSNIAYSTLAIAETNCVVTRATNWTPIA